MGGILKNSVRGFPKWSRKFIEFRELRVASWSLTQEVSDFNDKYFLSLNLANSAKTLLAKTQLNQLASHPTSNLFTKCVRQLSRVWISSVHFSTEYF